jgi:hypothetical protein
VKDLSKIAQSEPSDNESQKENTIRANALEVIVAVLHSLVDWSAELYEPPEETSSTSGTLYLFDFFLAFISVSHFFSTIKSLHFI